MPRFGLPPPWTAAKGAWTSRTTTQPAPLASDGEEWSSYAGGWPVGGGVFTVDRIRVGRAGSAELLGGAHVGAHLRGVLGGAEPSGRVIAVWEAPEC